MRGNRLRSSDGNTDRLDERSGCWGSYGVAPMKSDGILNGGSLQGFRGVVRSSAVFAFDHQHRNGDICSRATCEHARRAPALLGSEVFEDVPMRIIRPATTREYTTQPIPEGWCIPPLVYGCDHLYVIEMLSAANERTTHPNSETAVNSTPKKASR